MKKELKVVAIVLVALIVFLSGFGIGSTKGGFKINVNVENKGGQSAGVVATAQPTATPTTPAPTTPAPSDTPATSDQAQPSNNGTSDTTPAPSENNGGASATGMPSSKEEIAAKYNEVVNAAKKLTDGKIHKTNTVTLNCTDCSVGFLKGIVNTALKALATSSEDNYTFTGGKGVNDGSGNEADANGIFTPGGRDSALKAEYIANATSAAAGDGYTMSITLNAETSTYDGTTTVNPVGHESCLVPLNLATLELPIDAAEITAADMSYPGAKLDATVDGQGRLTKLVVNLPMSGSGTGAIKSASLSVGIEGSMDEVYEITY